MSTNIVHTCDMCKRKEVSFTKTLDVLPIGWILLAVVATDQGIEEYGQKILLCNTCFNKVTNYLTQPIGG